MPIPRASLLLFAGCLIAIAGCKQEEGISEETVKHPDRQEMRLRAGVYKSDGELWVFLIKGPKNEVAKNVNDFNSLVRSVKFVPKKDAKGEEPAWTDPPKNWRKDPPGSLLRHAAYRINAEPKEIEVTISKLSGAAGEDWQLTNLNRWRKQINLPPATAEDLKAPQVVEEKDITWFDIDGLGVHTVSKPPDPAALAQVKKQPFQVRPKAPPKGAAGGGGGKVPFKYVLPEGWEKAELMGQFMVERFTIGKDVQVTMTPLGGGDLAGNVNRWRKEIGLPPVGAKAIEESAAVIRAAGIPSDYVDIDNPGKNSRILGVIVPHEGTQWVMKMWGPSNRVGENKNGFETFVKSFKLDAR